MKPGNCLLVVALALNMSGTVQSQDKNWRDLQFTKWSKGINVPDPVAISFDSTGRAFVTQTTRRKANDLDIRNNRDWTVNDVSFESVDDKRNFYRSRLASELSNKNKRRVKDLNGDGVHDVRDLMQLSEKIHLVADTDQDGFADSISLFADNFQTEVTGIAAGVLHVHHPDNTESVYATIAPDVWRLKDTNGDGKADQREKIATGFGLHIAYAGHDMHGLTQGPDGKIYWSIGDKGISVTTREGRRFHYPNQGGVMRCNPDGTGFEVFAHGLRNVQELAFDQFGNLFGVDNDADQPGERERFVYIVKGMDAGWRCHYQYRGGKFNPWTKEKLWQTYHQGQPAYIIPPIEYSINGPCGFAFNPGTALNSEYRNYFFLTGAPHGEQIAFRAEPNGASFRMADVHQFGKGIPLIGINFGPDGALYGVDWANGYPLNQKGGIWKIDSAKGAKDPVRISTKKLLGQSRHDSSTESLLKHLGHPDQRIRLQAQFELVRRRDHSALQLVATDPKRKQLARIHAIWGIGQLDETFTTAWDKLLDDADPEIRAQTLRMISERQQFDTELLKSNVETDSKRVLFFLLQCLHAHGEEKWLPILVKIAKRVRSDEVYLRHGLAQALAGCEIEKRLDFVLDNELELLRLATVVALRQQRSTSVARFLEDPSTIVREEAARAIHDDFSIATALPALAKHTEIGKNSNRFLRRALNANLRLGRSENLNRLLIFLQSDGAPELQTEVLSWIASWEKPEPLDEVTGRFRKHEPRALVAKDRQTVEQVLTSLLSRKKGAIQAAIVKTLGQLGIRLSEKGLIDIVQNVNSDDSLVVESLRQLKRQKSESFPDAVRFVIKSTKSQLKLAGIEHLADLDPVKSLSEIKENLGRFKNASANQKLVNILSRIKNDEAVDFLNEQFGRYVEKQVGNAYALELFDAVVLASQQNDSSKALLNTFRKKVTSVNAATQGVGEFQLSLEGGDANRGKRIFETNIDAQCTRCHRVGKTGSSVGPALDQIASKRKPEHLLASIVTPNAEIDKKYQSILIALYTGKTLTGVQVESNDETITIADAMGKRIKILRDDIEQIAVQKKSLMPDLTKTLSKKQFRDLVAYLKSLK